MDILCDRIGVANSVVSKIEINAIAATFSPNHQFNWCYEIELKSNPRKRTQAYTDYKYLTHSQSHTHTFLCSAVSNTFALYSRSLVHSPVFNRFGSSVWFIQHLLINDIPNLCANKWCAIFYSNIEQLSFYWSDAFEHNSIVISRPGTSTRIKHKTEAHTHTHTTTIINVETKSWANSQKISSQLTSGTQCANIFWWTQKYLCPFTKYSLINSKQ